MLRRSLLPYQIGSLKKDRIVRYKREVLNLSLHVEKFNSNVQFGIL